MRQEVGDRLVSFGKMEPWSLTISLAIRKIISLQLLTFVFDFAKVKDWQTLPSVGRLRQCYTASISVAKFRRSKESESGLHKTNLPI